MIVIKILSTLKTRDVKTRKGPLTIRFQEGDLLLPGRRARYTEVTPPQGEEYTVGDLYTIAPGSVKTNDYDKLELARYVDLIPLVEAVKIASKLLEENTTTS